MEEDFNYDVFLSHSTKDKPTVRAIAERLRADGLRVWFDEWELKPGDSIPSKVEAGLKQTRVLVLCMSSNAYGSEWAQLESYTFRFRDPLNKDRRFIPLRLDSAPIEGSLAQFLYINWLPDERDHSYPKLLEACLPPATQPMGGIQSAPEQLAVKAIQLDCEGVVINAYAFSLDGKRALTSSDDRTVRLWDIQTGRCLRVFEGHTDSVRSVAWSPDERRALSAGNSDKTVRVWDVETGQCLRVLNGHTGFTWGVAWSPDGHRALSGSNDKTVRVWDVETGQCLRVLNGHTDCVNAMAWSADHSCVLSGSDDKTLRLWDMETGKCLRVFDGHVAWVNSVAWGAGGRYAISGGSSQDTTVRLWDVETGRCLRVLEGHTGAVSSVSCSTYHHLALSGGTGGCECGM